jgi:hypothetical protein
MNLFDAWARWYVGRRKSERDSFIVKTFVRLAGIYQRFSLYEQLKRSAERAGATRADHNYWIDWYVVVWTTVGIATYILLYAIPASLLFYLGFIVTAVGVYRIGEIATFHFRAALGMSGSVTGVSTVASHQRTFLLALFNYAEITLWFATSYVVFSHFGALAVSSPKFLIILRESLLLMTLNPTDAFRDEANASPYALWGLWIVYFLNAVVGLFMTVLVLARAISAIPDPGLDDDAGTHRSGPHSQDPTSA